ncbi:DnaB-like helicase N-terminal domain-containing protein [Streptomyces griseiscabiei]|uniref:DnaB-like helicase N-terminal domain-containing protein n=1 Tax=Streptomyces griseiscabiei TaxID=2993540 RepID=A0ABU4KXJ7_9ACTN|nr:DnaB-like helicase N-terminal domain-containing protein [Streptomyces griseiscabiei]MBZ3904405.1 replicative DNA helicase [Streptomyces griseiscabiei]MDX2908152.1 DnaB-like helicase N-terminal domain-containing protein [Streptomyces griseiscabiei]
MPPTPDNAVDDLDDLPDTYPPQPVYYAEQALLGALLLQPHRLHEVDGITSDSFSNYAHGALFDAIRVLPAPDPNQHTQDTSWLNAVLNAAREHARALTASYLHTLVQVCPRPRHAPAYARLVEAEHARRRIRKAAERLVHTVHGISLPDPVQPVLAEADALAAVVDDIAGRFPPRAGVLPRTTPPPPPAAHDPAEAVEEEQVLLATATAYPGEIGAVRWLLPGDLTLPLHAGLWQCLTALAHRREPVDPVTVLWEAQQRGLLDDGREAGEVLRMLAEPAGSIERWGERALRRSLLATAEHTGRRIEAYTGDPANTPFQLVVGARRALADIAAVRTRWQHATSPTPPQRRRPAVTTRAGPPTTTAAHPARSTRATR